MTRWLGNCNQPCMPPVKCRLRCDTTYHAWRVSFSLLWVHWWAVSPSKATPNLVKPMSAISDLKWLKSPTLGKSLRLRQEYDAGINKVSAMCPGLAITIETLRISRQYEWPQTDIHTEENACCTEYAGTWSTKRVHRLSKSKSPDASTTNYGCEDTLELDPGVGWARQLITWIPSRVA